MSYRIRPLCYPRRSFVIELVEAGVKDFRFHNLRHTAATRMADAGTDAFTLMKISGHSDIRMTARCTHATDTALRRAVANLVKDSDFGTRLAHKIKKGIF